MKITITQQRMTALFFSLALCAHTAAQAASDADLAQELTNPIANLVTVSVQINIDNNIGPADQGSKVFMNIQPVIPVDINDDWILITRTIMPVISQDEVVPGAGSQFGLGDINEQLFFSPNKPTASGIT